MTRRFCAKLRRMLMLMVAVILLVSTSVVEAQPTTLAQIMEESQKLDQDGRFRTLRDYALEQRKRFAPRSVEHLLLSVIATYAAQRHDSSIRPSTSLYNECAQHPARTTANISWKGRSADLWINEWATQLRQSDGGSNSRSPRITTSSDTGRRRETTANTSVSTGSGGYEASSSRMCLDGKRTSALRVAV